MSIKDQLVTIVRFTIICDHNDCFVKFDSDATSSIEARKKALEKGWSKFLAYDYDLCPFHVFSPNRLEGYID